LIINSHKHLSTLINFLETQTEKAGGFQIDSPDCCGRKTRYVEGFVCISSSHSATGKTGCSGTKHRQQHGPETQHIGAGQEAFFSLSSLWSAEQDAPESGVLLSLEMQMPPE